MSVRRVEGDRVIDIETGEVVSAPEALPVKRPWRVTCQGEEMSAGDLAREFPMEVRRSRLPNSPRRRSP